MEGCLQMDSSHYRGHLDFGGRYGFVYSVSCLLINYLLKLRHKLISSSAATGSIQQSFGPYATQVYVMVTSGVSSH